MDQVKRRVAVTGLGAISPVGLNVAECWSNTVAGRSGIDTITLLDPTPYTTRIAGEVKGYEADRFLDRKLAARSDRYTQFAIIAAREAFESAGLGGGAVAPERLGVIIGTGIGGLGTLETEHIKALEKGVDSISPFFCPMMIGNMASGRVAIELNARGIAFATVTACATSGHAIACAMDAIRLGRADAILAGGAEAPITMMGLGGFCSLKALSTRNDDPKTASRPFDRERDGFVMAEGASVVVLEDYDFAVRRGAHIHAELLGAGMTCDAYHITAPAEGGEGSARAMILAMEDAGITPGDVDYINAHGTSTELNDAGETQAIKVALGEDRARKVMISSTKSVTGHMLGAAGGIELIFSILAMRDGIVPPTATLVNPDPACDLDYVPGEARKADVRCALSNSFGFGGHNVTLAVGRR